MARTGMVMEPDPETISLLDHGVAELRAEGEVVGHLASTIETGWGSAHPFSKQLFLWYLVTLNDGSQYVIEDYPPYATLPDLIAGRLNREHRDGEPYEVNWLERDREGAWARFGMHDSPGSYKFEGEVPVFVEWPWTRFLRRRKK